MKSFVASIALLFTLTVAQAQTWTLDKAHSRLGFTITHLLISEVDGNFKTFDAKLTSEKADFSDAVFELTADINSINTDNEMRDGHLKGDKWFDAAKYPALTFKSTSFKKVDGKKYKLMGDLTMHGVTKPVTLDAVLTGPVTMDSPRGKQEKIGLKVNGTVKRTDFGVGSSGGATVSEEIEIKANGEFGKQSTAVADKK